jgi:hypothetical protein
MSTFRLQKPRCRVLPAAVAVAFAACLVTAAPALAQGEPKYRGWAKVENAREMRELKDKLRDGSALDAEAREFVRQTVLPQLALEAQSTREDNASTIERTRRRMREVVLTEIEDEKAFADMSRLVADFMAALARDGEAEPAVQVNAMLLLGEMRGKDGKPWPPVRPTLAAAAGDAKLPLAVRIAAIAGLGRHVEACGGDADATAALAQAAGPAIMAILAEPVVSDRRAEQEWLAARAVALLPALVPTAAKNVAAVLAAIVEDPARATDVRVRAAAALGATANAKSEINAAKLVDTIRGIALQSLEADVAAADVRRFEQQYRSLAAGQQALAQPGIPPAGGVAPADKSLAIPEQACRRDAWRLVTLADAIDAGEGRPGLAALLGPAAAPAKQLAATLRDAGLAIDQTPDEVSVVEAIKSIKSPAQSPAAGAAPAQPAAAAPEAPKPAPAEQPAGAPNASPFDSPF